MKTKLLPWVAIGSIVLAAGCGPESAVNKTAVGAVLGGAAGGAAGAQVGEGKGRTAAIIGGTILGALLGSSVGKTMDDVDRRNVQYSLESAPTGRASEWVNPDSGGRYQFTPTRTYQQAGQNCREYTMTSFIDGRPESVNGTACRQSDGSWQTR